MRIETSKNWWYKLSAIVMTVLVPVTRVEATTDPSGLQSGIEKAKTTAQGANLPIKFFAEILTNVITWTLGIAALLSAAAIIYGGVTYILSVGEESKVATAKRIIFYAIFGLIISAGSFAIVLALQDALT